MSLSVTLVSEFLLMSFHLTIYLKKYIKSINKPCAPTTERILELWRSLSCSVREQANKNKWAKLCGWGSFPLAFQFPAALGLALAEYVELVLKAWNWGPGFVHSLSWAGSSTAAKPRRRREGRKLGSSWGSAKLVLPSGMRMDFPDETVTFSAGSYWPFIFSVQWSQR